MSSLGIQIIGNDKETVKDECYVLHGHNLIKVSTLGDLPRVEMTDERFDGFRKHVLEIGLIVNGA